MIRKLRARTRQPQRPKGIDRHHAAANGVGLVVIGGIPCNLANNSVVDRLGSPQLTPGAYGLAYGPFPTGSDRLRFKAPLPSSGGIGGCLLVSLMRPATGAYERIIAAENGSSVLILFVDSAGAISVYFRGHRYNFNSLANFSVGSPVTFVISSSDWSSGNSANIGLLINGKRYSQDVSYVGNYGASYSDDRVSVGSDSLGNASVATRIFMLAYWPNRHLPDALMMALSINPWQLIAPEVIPLFFSTVTAQFLRPISDVSNSGWTPSTGSDLFACIGETVRNDSTYISATAPGAICEVLLGTSTGDPLSSINHLPRIVMSAGSGGIILRLKQGATLIKAWTYASLAGSDTLYEPTLTSGEIDSISDYTDLRLEMETTA